MAKILVVDDDPDFLEATRMVLEPAGHEVITATDGDEGLERSQQEEPDLVHCAGRTQHEPAHEPGPRPGRYPYPDGDLDR